MRDAFRRPAVRLHGPVEERWIDDLLAAADAAGGELMVVEVMTTGGDAEVGRRLALEVALLRERGVRPVLLGKTVVYSAGVTFMSGFKKDDRWLTGDCRMLVHERQLTKTIHLDGPLAACRTQLAKAMAEIDCGELLEREGFAALADGSSLSADEVRARAEGNWYLTAAEARDLGLIAGIFVG
ncbi:MAG: peptidase S14 [Brevundimonas sp.]|nr:MAG: peptidase S14 [Brevundimonas sp.]